MIETQGSQSSFVDDLAYVVRRRKMEHLRVKYVIDIEHHFR